TTMNVKAQKSGSYTCTATNKAGSDAISYLLDVLVPPSIISRSAPERLVLAGDAFELHCDASGYPEPSIRWTLNGQSLNMTLNERQDKFASRSHTVLNVHSAPSIVMLFERAVESEAGVDTMKFLITTF
ncbi:Protein HIM-4 a, partial [Aphelenchoides avenae]